MMCEVYWERGLVLSGFWRDKAIEEKLAFFCKEGTLDKGPSLLLTPKT